MSSCSAGHDKEDKYLVWEQLLSIPHPSSPTPSPIVNPPLINKNKAPAISKMHFLPWWKGWTSPVCLLGCTACLLNSDPQMLQGMSTAFFIFWGFFFFTFLPHFHTSRFSHTHPFHRLIFSCSFVMSDAWSPWNHTSSCRCFRLVVWRYLSLFHH